MKLDHMVVMVRSMPASEPWYRALLSLIGFTPARENVWGNADGVFIDLKEAEPDTHGYERRGPGLNHLGFTAPTILDLDRVCAAMAAAGFDVPEKQYFGDTVSVFFKDPDGMRIEISHYG